MKSRICLLGAALCIAPLALGVATATASGKGGAVARATCHTATSQSVPKGSLDVEAGAPSGFDWGTASCGSWGKGAQGDSFTVPESGNTDAKFVWYLPTGTLHGKYTLVPQSGSFNFLAQSYVGTLKITGGTGKFAGAKGKGKMTCNSADPVHMSCKDKVKLSKL